MKQCRRFLKHHSLCLPLYILFSVPMITTSLFICDSNAVTVSAGDPFKGKLINGVQFPMESIACKPARPNRSYTTPEVAGILLQTFEEFRRKYPDSCDIVLGDLSQKHGGRLGRHESHQNGRDVDLGLFAKNNTALRRFVPMNHKNLDVAKTWHLIESLIKTQHVECIFLDKSVQALLYRYASSKGVDPGYLSYVFDQAPGTGKKERIVQHEPGHSGHMHVRFFAPWSTLAGQLKKMDEETRTMIEAGQQSFYHPETGKLPRKHGDDVKELAKFFRVKSGEMADPAGLLERPVGGLGEFLVLAGAGLNWTPSTWQATLRAWAVTK